jgi:hypothetical protein
LAPPTTLVGLFSPLEVVSYSATAASRSLPAYSLRHDFANSV